MTDDPTARLARAAQLIEIGRWEAALTELGPLLGDPETQVEANQLTAMALAGLGRPQEALAHAERAVGLAPHDLSALLTLADTQRINGQRRPAQVTIQRALELDPGNPELLMQSAIARSDIGDPNGAHADAHAAVRAIPQSASAHFAMGYVTHEVRPDIARIAYRRALELDPHHLAARQNLAQVESPTTESLVTSLTELLADNPQSAILRLNLIRQLVGPLWMLCLGLMLLPASLLFTTIDAGLLFRPLLFISAFVMFQAARRGDGALSALEPLGGLRIAWQLLRTERLAVALVLIVVGSAVGWLLVMVLYLAGVSRIPLYWAAGVLCCATLAGGLISLLGRLRHKRLEEAARWT